MPVLISATGLLPDNKPILYIKVGYYASAGAPYICRTAADDLAETSNQQRNWSFKRGIRLAGVTGSGKRIEAAM